MTPRPPLSNKTALAMTFKLAEVLRKAGVASMATTGCQNSSSG